MIDRKPPEITSTDEIAMMYPAPASSAVVTALVPPKVLPTNVMNPPVDGCARANWDSVLASSAIATAAARIVSGAAMPAVMTISPKPNMKLYAGPMFAIVDAEMSIRRRAPRLSRSGDSGAFVSVNGMDAGASLIGHALRSVRIVHSVRVNRQPAAFGELLDVGVAAGPAAETGLPDPAERSQRLILRCRVVDVNHPGPQPPGKLQPGVQVAGQHRVDQAVAGVVGDRDRLVGTVD